MTDQNHIPACDLNAVEKAKFRTFANGFQKETLKTYRTISLKAELPVVVAKHDGSSENKQLPLTMIVVSIAHREIRLMKAEHKRKQANRPYLKRLFSWICVRRQSL